MTFSRSLRRCLLATVALATSLAAQSPKHMLFRAIGPNGATVYLLGSVHLLSPDAAKLPAVVDSAFAHAKTLVLETNLDSAAARAGEMLPRLQYTGGATLRSSLSPGAVAKLDTILRGYGLSVDQLNGFKPWAVSMVMSQMAMMRANFQAQYGVDAQLNVRAHEAGKPVLGLESVDFQLGLFDSLSPAAQERMVLESGSPDSTVKVLTMIKDAWVAGDATKLDSLINKPGPGSEAMMDLLITKRNLSWIPKIDELLKGKDDVLVVVGAGHLVGKRGVIELLRAKGYKVEQL